MTKKSASEFPKNFALIRTLQKQKKLPTPEPKKVAAPVAPQQPQQPMHNPAEELCPKHNRKLEIICIDDRVRVCANCALFGEHKGHEVRQEDEVIDEITRTGELLMTMYQVVEDLGQNKINQSQVEKLSKDF